MRAIIINATNRTITETEIDGSLKTLQQIVGGLIQPVYDGLDDNHHCYVNEEGLLEGPQHFFMFSDGHQPSPAMASSCHPRTTATKPPAPCRSTGSKNA